MSFASIFGGALAYGLFFYFANNKEITGFSTLAFLTPVFALLTGGIWLDERLTCYSMDRSSVCSNFSILC